MLVRVRVNAAARERSVEELSNLGHEGEGRARAGVAARAGGDGHQPVGTLLERLAGGE